MFSINLPFIILLISFKPSPIYSQSPNEENANIWSQYSPYVESYTITTNDDEPPEFINPCGPGEVRDQSTASCLPGVSSEGNVIIDHNPCGAGASCTPGVGLEGAQDLINPGMLQELIQQNGNLIN